MAAHTSPRRLERAADAELVQLTRKGDTDAYATLFRRHASAAASVARSVTSAYEPDDLVSEAYARILHALRCGNGPTAAFRPYLFTTVRNIAASWGRSGREAVPLEPEELEELAVQDDHALAALDRSLTAQAFRSLPARWQEALWYSEVEGMQPAELAPLLGMRPQAAAALCYRAREGLRQAWIRAHLSSVDLPEECAWTVERLAAHSRGRLGKRDRARVDAHLETCERCSMAAAEAEEAGAGLALILLPLLIGTGAAVAYTATVKTGAVAGAAAAGAGAAGAAHGTAGTVHGAAAAGSSGAVFGGTTGIIVGVAASIVVVGAATAGVFVASSPDQQPDTVSAMASQGSHPAPGHTSPQGTGPSSTDPSSPPAPPATTPSPASPADDGTPGSSDGAGSLPTTIDSPAGPITPVNPVGPANPTDPTGPTGPTEPTGPADPTKPLAPTITNDPVTDTGNGRYFPIVSGTAVPGATVTVSADPGPSVTVVADPTTGAWRSPPLVDDDAAADAVSASPSVSAVVPKATTDAWAVRATTTPGATVPVTVTAMQTVNGILSPSTSPVTFTIAGPPLTVAGLFLDGSPLVSINVAADAGTFEILVDGAPAASYRVIGSLYLLPFGTHDVSVRYVDGSGRFGPSTHATVLVGLVP